MRHFNRTITDTMTTVFGIRRSGNIVTGLATRGLLAPSYAWSLLVRPIAHVPTCWHRVKPGSGAALKEF